MQDIQAAAAPAGRDGTFAEGSVLAILIVEPQHPEEAGIQMFIDADVAIRSRTWCSGGRSWRPRRCADQTRAMDYQRENRTSSRKKHEFVNRLTHVTATSPS